MSEFFKLDRGCRQGDPWSPYLFVLCVEPLSQAIKNKKDINGININHIIYKIGQCADDTFILLDGFEKSLRNCILLLDRYADCSGLKLNVTKTHAVWLGSKVKCQEHICPDLCLQWVDKMLNLNYDHKLVKVENILTAYGKRNLSLIGKVSVIKTLIY